jgi:eukaryotic-like serine/threonine-protein kinase
VTRPRTRISPRWRPLASLLLGALLLLTACDLPLTPPKPVPGALRWRVQIADTQRATPVFVANGLVYLAGADHAVYALDAATGKQHWRTDLGAAAFVSAVADGAVYVMALDQEPYAYAIYALDAATGAKRWHIQTRQSPSVDATVANGLVYFGEWSGPVFALDAATGAQRWQGDGANQYAAPAVANGTLYDISKIDNGAVVAIDAATGIQRWQVQAGANCCSMPAVADGVVYVGAFDHTVYALDATTGAFRWSVAIGDEMFTTPAVANGMVYLGSYDQYIYALDVTTGALRWRFQTGDRIVSAPTVANGVVYVASTELDQFVYALDAKTGAVRWKYQTGWGYFAPAVANGLAYVASNDGYLYALNA